MLGSCRASYSLTVPDNVPLEIQTSSGSVSVAGVRASVTVDTSSGAIAAAASAASCCARARTRATSAPSRSAPPTGSSCARAAGDVRAVVPSGRYQIDAQSDSGSIRIRGLSDSADAPFQIQALSTSGDVSVEAEW